MDEMRCPSPRFAQLKYDPTVFKIETVSEATPIMVDAIAWFPAKSVGDPTEQNPVTPDKIITGRSR
jgi:hypothetical protein